MGLIQLDMSEPESDSQAAEKKVELYSVMHA